MEDKKILDACCGSRMMWFDKHSPETIYADKRTESHILCDGRALEISPDIEMDFTSMTFEDNTFNLVVFDPPHLNKLGKNSWMAKKYGVLLPTWETDIKAGFDECMRVLKPNGVLIFKWNENQIKINKIIEIIGNKPLFGHPSGKAGVPRTTRKRINKFEIMNYLGTLPSRAKKWNGKGSKKIRAIKK